MTFANYLRKATGAYCGHRVSKNMRLETKDSTIHRSKK